jgi:hypothetical protein
MEAGNLIAYHGGSKGAIKVNFILSQKGERRDIFSIIIKGSLRGHIKINK